MALAVGWCQLTRAPAGSLLRAHARERRKVDVRCADDWCAWARGKRELGTVGKEVLYCSVVQNTEFARAVPSAHAHNWCAASKYVLLVVRGAVVLAGGVGA